MQTDVTTVAAVLFNAADLIEEHGWVQNRLGNVDDGFCAVGAIHEAAYGLVDRYSAYPVIDTAVAAVAQDVGQRVPTWNDGLRKFRGKRKVVRQLRYTGNRILY